jgi:hypothetical protein
MDAPDSLKATAGIVRTIHPVDQDVYDEAIGEHEATHR